MEYFSRSLSHELKNKGVLCQNHLPLMVATKLAIPNPARRARGTLFTPLPEVWAKASVNSIGSAPSVIPYWAHRLQVRADSSVARFLSSLRLSRMASVDSFVPCSVPIRRCCALGSRPAQRRLDVDGGQAAAMLAVPAWVLDMAVYSTHDKIRRSALKKRENAKSQ